MCACDDWQFGWCNCGRWPPELVADSVMAQPEDPEADEAYYLEQVTLDDDDDDDYAYEEVEVDDGEDEVDPGVEAEDEDLEQALQTLRTKEDGAPIAKEDAPPRSDVTRRPEVLDDFIRNVLLKMGMTETLDMFQREWYRLSGEGKLSEHDIGTVPDIYLRNQQLADELRNMQAEMQRQQEVRMCAAQHRRLTPAASTDVQGGSLPPRRLEAPARPSSMLDPPLTVCAPPCCARVGGQQGQVDVGSVPQGARLS